VSADVTSAVSVMSFFMKTPSLNKICKNKIGL
jgi:hypothetical protein